MTMTEKEIQQIKDDIEIEGFLYNFVHGTSYKKIMDEKFHILRQEFIASANELADYIGLEYL